MTLSEAWSESFGEWLTGRGPQSDIVMSARVRLARNVATFPFLTRITESRKSELAKLLRGRLERAELGETVAFHDIEEMAVLDRQCLVERHLISRDLETAEGDRGVMLSGDETLSIMVNEEDHLRMQALRSGFQLREAWDRIRAIDDTLESSLDFAFSPRFGYLTACPTNVGTGLRVSVMLHLPALVLTKSINKIFKAMTKIHLAVRGFYGEGTQATGDFFQISNQVSLGRTEEEIVKLVEDHVPQIITTERSKREQLVETNRTGIEDRVWRALGMLERARTLSLDEAMSGLSAVRLGINLGLVDAVPLKLINELFIVAQPAHLQKAIGEELPESEHDRRRAELVRTRLAAGT